MNFKGKTGGKGTEICKALSNQCGRETELLVKANDQAGLTSQAVNVEQTVPGKPSPNDRPSQEKNKG